MVIKMSAMYPDTWIFSDLEMTTFLIFQKNPIRLLSLFFLCLIDFCFVFPVRDRAAEFILSLKLIVVASECSKEASDPPWGRHIVQS